MRRTLLTAGVVTVAVGAAAAGVVFGSGRDPDTPTDADPGKIEVVEFFWFGCPHCYSLEPLISAWSKKLPADVVFRRQHVPFREVKHQQLYFTLQAIGQDSEKVLTAVFDAIHQQRKRMLDPKEMDAVLDLRAMTELGVPGAGAPMGS